MAMNPLPDNARAWPFAAMDYSIMLAAGPSVGGIGDLIAGETWKDGCATEDGDMVTFFRRRNALERLAADADESTGRKSGTSTTCHICVDIPDTHIPKIDDDKDMCYNRTEPAGGLTSKHFLSPSTSQANPPMESYPIEKVIMHEGLLEAPRVMAMVRIKHADKLPSEEDAQVVPR